jgi:predicted DNA-binding transcriptional regulator YafY
VTFAFGEAAALLLAASVGRSMAGVGPAELAAALTRLKEAFPPEFHNLLGALDSGRQDAGKDDHRQRVLELLEEALATGTAVRMVYATASRDNAESERVVEPYALVPFVRSFHLVGFCHLRGQVRIFKVDRIRELALTSERYRVPEDFDLSAYLGEGWGLLRGVTRAPETVRIRFAPRAGRWVSEEHWHRSQRAQWQPDGSLILSLELGVNPAFIRWVLYYGEDAQVLQPAWLAEAVCQEAWAVLARYSQESKSRTSAVTAPPGRTGR